MHKVFGVKEDAEYYDREGAYIIPVCGNKVGVVKTPKGWFLLGGGLEKDESHIQCIERECMEEAGYTVSVGRKICSAETYCFHETIGFFHPIQTYYVGKLISKVCERVESAHVFEWVEYEKIKGKMYFEMQSWTLDKAFEK